MKKKTKVKNGRGTCSAQVHHHHHHHPGRNHNRKKVVIKQYDEIPNRYRNKIDPLNLEELKLQFLKHGQVPHFQFKVTPEKVWKQGNREGGKGHSP